MPADLEFVRELGKQLRVDSIRSSTAAGAGHPTSSMSAADLLAGLISNHLHYDWKNPDEPNNDHLIFSKGHASPLVYAVFKAVGVITDAEMLTFRQFGSPLQGHPTPVLPWVDAATGSPGPGHPVWGGDSARRQIPRQAALPRLDALRRLRDRRGVDLGRPGQGRPLQAL